MNVDVMMDTFWPQTEHHVMISMNVLLAVLNAKIAKTSTDHMSAIAKKVMN
jgi:hypothetical protein